MSKNFQVRLGVSLILLLLATIFLFTFKGVPFRIFFAFFAIISSIELFSFFKKSHNILNIIMACLELLFLICGSIFISKITILEIILVIFGVCGYDVFAYLFGNMIGGYFFKKSRPFPFVSKNKTWEGTFMGLVSSFVLIASILLITDSYNFIFLLTGPLALIGDLFESFIKRTFKIKDSNENIITNNIFKKLEILVGGNEGHGGYLDRIDSIAFTCSILLLFSIL